MNSDSEIFKCDICQIANLCDAYTLSLCVPRNNILGVTLIFDKLWCEFFDSFTWFGVYECIPYRRDLISSSKNHIFANGIVEYFSNTFTQQYIVLRDDVLRQILITCVNTSAETWHRLHMTLYLELYFSSGTLRESLFPRLQTHRPQSLMWCNCLVSESSCSFVSMFCFLLFSSNLQATYECVGFFFLNVLSFPFRFSPSYETKAHLMLYMTSWWREYFLNRWLPS